MRNIPLVFQDGFAYLPKKTFIFDHYLKDWDWPWSDTVVAHIHFDVTLECCCNTLLIRDKNGPTISVNQVDKIDIKEAIITDFASSGSNVNNGKMLEWGAIVVKGDMPGWSIGFTVGSVFTVHITYGGPDPTDVITAPIGGVIGALAGGLFESIFDDEVFWAFHYKLSVYCVHHSGLTVMASSPGIVSNEYHDNDWDDFYTEHSSSSVLY